MSRSSPPPRTARYPSLVRAHPPRELVVAGLAPADATGARSLDRCTGLTLHDCSTRGVETGAAAVENALLVLHAGRAKCIRRRRSARVRMHKVDGKSESARWTAPALARLDMSSSTLVGGRSPRCASSECRHTGPSREHTILASRSLDVLMWTLGRIDLAPFCSSTPSARAPVSAWASICTGT